MANGDDLLNERLEQSDQVLEVPRKTPDSDGSEPQEVRRANSTSFDFVQWSAEPNETFRPSGQRRETLPAGVYLVGSDDRGLYFARRNVVTDTLIELDDSASIQVLEGIRTFWASKKEYTKRGIVYKRGVLLWGPAGSGKTATLMLMTGELIRNEGIVILCDHPGVVIEGIASLRRIESARPIIVVLEDIDELISRYGEHGILSLLDGENQVSNVVNIATTNYPERLGARIVNRPSRFDERIFIDMPNEKSRRRYLQHATRAEEMSETQLDRWVEDTGGFSIAHLRELVVAVFCLKQEYGSVIERLSKMRIQPKSRSEMKNPENLGFASAGLARSR